MQPGRQPGRLSRTSISSSCSECSGVWPFECGAILARLRMQHGNIWLRWNHSSCQRRGKWSLGDREISTRFRVQHGNTRFGWMDCSYPCRPKRPCRRGKISTRVSMQLGNSKQHWMHPYDSGSPKWPLGCREIPPLCEVQLGNSKQECCQSCGPKRSCWGADVFPSVRMPRKSKQIWSQRYPASSPLWPTRCLEISP